VTRLVVSRVRTPFYTFPSAEPRHIRLAVKMNNYWESTQRKFWTFTKQQLATERKKMEEAERNLVNMYPLPDRRLLSIYFYHRRHSQFRSLLARC
jgi:hypothetical protein